MATYILAAIIFMTLFALMAVGVIFSNKPIKGSCGGLSAIGLGDGECEICGGDLSKCEEANAQSQPAEKTDTSLAYDATRKS